MARILLGVSAGIAAYKALDLASKLTQRGDEVRTIMTPHSLRFVTPLSFRAVTRQQVYTDTFEDDPDHRPEHISLADWPDVLCVAPATADLIARMAAGLGDNLLTVTIIASTKPVIVAPAMNDKMWGNPIVRRNVESLKALGYRFVEPGTGQLACGTTGPGRLADPPDLVAAIDAVLRESRT
jgi:phosphopantothenoylcysteine decarboxylase/phosphopantothenate--cysteine ligase